MRGIGMDVMVKNIIRGHLPIPHNQEFPAGTGIKLGKNFTVHSYWNLGFLRAKELNLDLKPRLEIKCSLNNKHNFVLGLDYINLYSKYNIAYYSVLSKFDYNIALFVCNFSDKNSLNNLKNFKFEKSHVQNLQLNNL